ncbi:manganese peroxidase 1 [Gymnopilus junonius]|uniref:Peroxidase n=1 Tax=Gymnopilus junonius TaxID=109634 RepID=A0A9P5NJ85_GYMJU|nr:manganese peroxidase 1 [Gymnopilus junonius]
MGFGRLAIFVAVAAFHYGSAAVVKRTVTCPTGQTTANEACCVLFPVIDLIQQELFDGGECGEEAHAALRLTFHDAIGFSKNGGLGGGADGSILAFNSTETQYAANEGIDDIIARQFPVFLKSGLSPGDFVHLAGNIGANNCPGTPQLPFSFGRPPPIAPAPDLTVPLPTDSVTDILARMADAGFSTPEVIWLLSSHSIAAADKIDPTIPRTPFDSTPGTYDTQFYLEVLLKGTLFPGNGSQSGEVLSPIAGEMRLQSDFAFSQDSRTACLWQEPINDQSFIQGKFVAAMTKLQVLGQTNLTDCSDVIPTPAPFTADIHFPASFDQNDVQVACTTTAFPSLATVSGPAPTIPPVPAP